MKQLILLAVLTLMATGCTPGQEPQTKDAQYYLQEGEKLLEKNLYEDAIAAWEKVRDSYYSPELNILAEMKIADAYFMGEKYPEAAAAYEDFLRQHPEHSRTPRILYRLGQSYYNQVRAADQDQTATRNAKVTFETLLERYPDFDQADEVAVLIERCESLLADHELYVGRFYLRTGHPDAAIGRFQDILENYPENFHHGAYFYLGKTYLEKGERKLAAEAFNTLIERYPRSEYIDKAQKFLARRN